MEPILQFQLIDRSIWKKKKKKKKTFGPTFKKRPPLIDLEPIYASLR